MKHKSLILKISLLGIVLFTGVAATLNDDHSKSFEISKNIEIFTNLYKELNTYYVDDLEPSKLMRTGIDAMVESLDPFTNYISESEIEGYRYITEGKYNGIGAAFEKIGDYITITEPMEGSPAQKAGLKAGDKIVAVDGKPAKGKSLEDVGDILRGAPGTDVEVTISRPGTPKELKVTINREEVQENNVPYHGMLNDEIGYFTLTIFTREAADNVAKAVKDLKEKNPKLKGVVFDLRGNGGGLLTEAVNICNVFLPKGELIVTTKGKVVEWDRSFKTLNQPVDENIPIVVVLDKGSASASEIVSGTLQDLDRAVLIGQRSYGKGLVQNTKEVGYNARVKLTTAKYYIPSGRCIQAVSYDKGKPVDISDSLRTPFRTRNGRKVLDGGGIKPDVILDKEKDWGTLIALRDQFIIFDYVTQYCLKNEKIASVEDFHFTAFDDFVSYVESRGFDYETESDKLLKQLNEQAIKDKLSIATDVSALKEKIKSNKKAELNQNKIEIIKMIEKEIAGRYYFQNGKIKMGLRNDSEIEEAINILKDQTRYKSILKK